MKRIILVLMAVALAMPVMAQTKGNDKDKKAATSKKEAKDGVKKEYKKVYDETLDGLLQIDQAMELAKHIPVRGMRAPSAECSSPQGLGQLQRSQQTQPLLLSLLTRRTCTEMGDRRTPSPSLPT